MTTSDEDLIDGSHVGDIRLAESRSLPTAKVALVVSVALFVSVVALTLSGAPLRVVQEGVKSEATVGTTTGTATVCQNDETIPGGVTAIRIGLDATFGPPVSVRAYSGSRILTSGSRAPNWEGSSVTVQVKPLAHAATHVKLCLYVPANSSLLQLYGAQTDAQQAAIGLGGRLSGRYRVEYLTASRNSWWSRIHSVARHIGLGHFTGGSWIALLAAILATAVGGLVIALAWKEIP